MSLRRLSALCALLLTSGAAAGPQHGGVTLLEPYATATVDANTLNEFRFAALDRIDPARPAEADAQTLSLFGREDLIAATNDEYRPVACAPGGDAGDVVDAIVRRARATSVVIVNESHIRTEYRGFTTALLPRLRAEGYRALAMEALFNPLPGTAQQYMPAAVRTPGLAWLEDEDGYYLGEAAFGRLGRTAKRLGYALVPYEAYGDANTARLSEADQIAQREEGQASALAAWIARHPGTKLVVHVGYSHAREMPRANGERWMAARLKAKTGIDPLTISQTTCRGGGAARRSAALPAKEPAGSFDIVVDHPTPQFFRGRPAWRIAAGDVATTIPAALRPTKGWRVIEARPDGEPVTAVPMDRVAIRPGEDVALLLPPGRYRLRAIDPVALPKPAD